MAKDPSDQEIPKRELKDFLALEKSNSARSDFTQEIASMVETKRKAALKDWPQGAQTAWRQAALKGWPQ